MKKILGDAGFYQNLTTEQLYALYRAEIPLEAILAGRRYRLPVSIVIESSDDRHPDLVCEKRPDKYSIPDILADYTRPVAKALDGDEKSHDGQVVRLASLENDTLVLQEASYYEGVATNFAMDHRPEGHSKSLRELLHAESGGFGDFENNPLVNHIGVVCMIETSDGKLIVQKRSQQVTNRGDTLSSSVSGAVDWADIAPLSSPFSIGKLAESALREAFEELGIAIKDIDFLGLLREFPRGGKPEIYYFARTDMPFQTAYDKWKKNARDDTESREIFGYEFLSTHVRPDKLSRDAFEERTGRILDQIGKSANLTLVTGVVLTAKHILKKCSS